MRVTNREADALGRAVAERHDVGVEGAGPVRRDEDRGSRQGVAEQGAGARGADRVRGPASEAGGGVRRRAGGGPVTACVECGCTQPIVAALAAEDEIAGPICCEVTL